MKNVLMLLAFLSFTLLSCSNDDLPETTDYDVVIKVISPTPNSTYAISDKVPIEVSFNRNTDEVIHHVKVEMISNADNSVKVLLEEHAHETETFTYANDQGFSIGDAGTYTLRATSHDMDGNHAEPVEVTITAQ